MIASRRNNKFLIVTTVGEMYSTAGESGLTCHLPRENGVAYAAQESWVFNDTIRVWARFSFLLQ